MRSTNSYRTTLNEETSDLHKAVMLIQVRYGIWEELQKVQLREVIFSSDSEVNSIFPWKK